jgi:hypothetical protein
MKHFSVFLALVLALGLTGCGGKLDSADQKAVKTLGLSRDPLRRQLHILPLPEQAVVQSALSNSIRWVSNDGQAAHCAKTVVYHPDTVVPQSETDMVRRVRDGGSRSEADHLEMVCLLADGGQQVKEWRISLYEFGKPMQSLTQTEAEELLKTWKVLP